MSGSQSLFNAKLESYITDGLVVSFLQEWLKEYNLSGEHPTWESSVIHLLRDQNASRVFTPKVVNGILKSYKNIPKKIKAELQQAISNYKPPQPSEGEIVCLGVNEVEKRGVAYTVQVLYSQGSDSSKVNLQPILRNAVNCVRDLYERQKMLVPFWESEKYSFKVSTIIRLEDKKRPELSGDSIGLAFALAYFSKLTEQKVPATIAVTGALDENGEALHVDSINEKLSCLPNERNYIKKVLYPSHCKDEISEETKKKLEDSNILAIPVKTLEEAIYLIFGERAFDKAKFRNISVGESLSIADRYAEERKCNEAIKIYHYLHDYESHKTKPNYQYLTECAFGLFKCYDHTGELSKAENFGSKAMKYFRNLPRELQVAFDLKLHDRLGVLYTDLFLFKAAEKTLKDAITRVDKRSYELLGNLHSHLGQLYMKWKHYKEAETQFKAAIEAFKKFGHKRYLAKNYCYLLELCGATHRFDKAEDIVEKIEDFTEEAASEHDFEGDQENTQRFFNLLQKTILHARGRKYNLAINHANQALNLYRNRNMNDNPHLGRLQAYHGISMVESGKVNSGVKVLDRSIKSFNKAKSPDTDVYAAAVHLFISLVYLRSGKIRDAKERITKAFKLIHDNSSNGVRQYFAPEIRALKVISNAPSLSGVRDLEKRIKAIIDKVPL